MSRAPNLLSIPGTMTKTLMNHKIDLAFGFFILFLTIHYAVYISPIQVPRWDGAVYLENAQNWLEGKPLLEPFRPQLFSWIISGIWSITAENWLIIKYLQASFTLGAGVLLYLTLRKYKGGLFAIGVVSLTMLNAQVFYYSAHILTEGVSLFFLVLALYFLKGEKPKHWLLAGISIGLTFASRYPIILQAGVILLIESLIRKNPRIFRTAMIGAIPTISIVILVLFLKTGTFEVALDKDTGLSLSLSPFYILQALPIWSFAIFLVPVAFFFRRTYTDKYNYTFIAWFIVSLIFWSANTSNHQERFAIQYTPAVYFLAVLAIENIVKSKSIFQSLREYISHQDSVDLPSAENMINETTAPSLNQQEIEQLKASISAMMEVLHKEGTATTAPSLNQQEIEQLKASISAMMEVLQMEGRSEEILPTGDMTEEPKLKSMGALRLPSMSTVESTQSQAYTKSNALRRIPIPKMPGYYRKEGESENIIYQEGFED